jgi:hypothetical protein
VDATLLLRADHLERPSVSVSSLSLHLDDDETSSAAEDEVELVSAGTNIRGEQAVAAQAIVAKRTALTRVHAAS